ncbi:MAG: type II secretory pathway component GspD/PulD (secretin) [Pseudohongiellaceae bacterium]|jgi:type II secretory pathway component GspD/PulD (secretin)
MRNSYFSLLGSAFVVLLTSCASVNEIELANEGSVTEWQSMSMPAPITQRYPTLEFQSADKQSGRPAIKARASSDYYTCTDNEQSTLTDELAPLDISFLEVDIQDAIIELSLLTGISIITDDSIQGVVSISFTGETLDTALEAIIAPGNFGFKKYANFIFVGSQSPVSPSFHLLSSTCMYKPVFLDPEQIVGMLTPFYQEYVSYFAGHDHLSIVAPESIQSRIQKDIRIFDESPQQILLEMSIVEVSEEALDLLGIKWSEATAEEVLAQSGQTGGGNIYSYLDPSSSESPLALAFIDSISAVDTNEGIQIRAMPSMVTLNGREANFSSTQTAWLPIMNIYSSNQENIVSYGVDLQIVPYISLDGQVRLEILRASVSDLDESFENRPRLISHQISTSVLLMDGETLVLGGLLQKKTRNRRTAVPGVSKTPLFGGLFRSKEEEEVTTEVLIIIRPKILKS